MRDRLPIGDSLATEGARDSVAQTAAAAGVAAAAAAASLGEGGGSPGRDVHKDSNSPLTVAADRTDATTQHAAAAEGTPAANDDTVGGGDRGALPGGGPASTPATAPAADEPLQQGAAAAIDRVIVQCAGGDTTTSPHHGNPTADTGSAGALATSPLGEPAASDVDAGGAGEGTARVGGHIAWRVHDGTTPAIGQCFPASMISPTLTELPSYRDRMTLSLPSCDVTPRLATTERQDGACANIRCGEDAASNRTVCSFEAHWPSRPLPGLHQQTAMQIAVSWVCLMACWQPEVFLPGPRQVAVLRGVMEAAGVEDTVEMQREVLRGAMEVKCP